MFVQAEPYLYRIVAPLRVKLKPYDIASSEHFRTSWWQNPWMHLVTVLISPTYGAAWLDTKPSIGEAVA
jgi:hypothetical protein